ncbi:uncharacterized protein LOC144014787 [Festucalex cinctus]
MAPGDPRRGPLGTFAPLPACLQGNHGLQAPPLRPLGAGGPGTVALGPAVGHFSHQQLCYWPARASDPWVVSILTHGYELQFRRRPPASCRVRVTHRRPGKSLSSGPGAVRPPGQGCDRGRGPPGTARGLLLDILPCPKEDRCSLAPRVFTRFVEAALAPLQSVGMKVLPYLDDWLLCAPSRAQVIQDTSDLLSHVARLGIRVNLPKSSLVPSQRTDFIGVKLDTTVMRAHPPPRRRCSSPPCALSRGQAVALRRLLAAFGQADVHDGCGPVGSADTAPTTEVAERLPLGCQVAPPPEAQGVPSVPPRPGTLEGEGFSIERSPAGCGPRPPRNNHHGCQPHGLGCCLAAQDGSGKLVCARQGRSHQCAGASGGVLGTHALLAIPERTACSHTVGQHHDRVSNKPSGRRQVRPSVGDLPAPSQVGCSPSGQSTGHLSAGGSEPARGLSLPSGSSSGRVAPPPRGGAHDLEQLRHGGGRSLCLRGLNPLPTLVFPERGHQPSGSGCTGAAVAGVPSLRLSAAPSDMADASESSSGGAHAVADGPLLAGPDVVPPAPSTVLRRAVASPRQGGPVVSTGRSGLASRPSAPSRMCLATEGPQPLLTGCTESVTRTILNARAPSTRQQYANKWKLFVTWCGERGVDPVSCSIPTILVFLQSLLDKGRSQSTLKVYVAAISARHVGADGGSVGRHELVSLFLRGALRLRPRPAPRVPAWDLQLVLDGLCRPPFEPLAGADLLWVSRKTALLLAVASAKRVSDLHALSVSPECLRWHPDGAGVTLWPNTAFIPKVLSGSRSNQPLRLKRYVPTPADGGDRPELLCPVRALQCYIDATAGIRTSAQLFVCYGGPTKGSALSKQRLSHWVGDAIRHSYLLSGRPLPSGVRCHSTRSVATSWAALRGVSLEDICAAASWATPCTFSRFYSVDVASPHPLGVILGPAGASQ